MNSLSPVTPAEIKTIAFDILKYFRSVCEENHIPYSLAYGTLLGAVRHSGFIPWDDDVDVFLLRRDYDRFLQAVQQRPHPRFQLFTAQSHPDFFYAYAKLIDTDTVMKEYGVHPFSGNGVFVDIFPLDNIPSDEKGFERFTRRLRFNAALHSASVIQHLNKFQKPLRWKLSAALLMPLAKLFGTKFWLKRYDKLLHTYDGSETEYVCCLTENPSFRERIKRTRMEHLESVLFEGEPFSCMAETEQFLIDRYGDYRKLPPVEARGLQHNFSAWHRPEKPVLLHVAYLTDDAFSGVNVAVAGHLRAQQKEATIGLLNIGPGTPDGLEQLTYRKPFRLDELPEPFCRPDLVIFQETYRADYLTVAAQLRRRKIPYITVPHGELSASAQQHKHLKKAVANATLFYPFIHGAKAIQCLSPFELEEVHFPVPKFLATNGIALPPQAKTDFRQDGFQFVFVGRLSLAVKGLDLMTEAVAQVADDFRKHRAQLHLYGPDREDTVARLTEMIAAQKVEDLVFLHNAVSGEEKESVLKDADLFIQTSRHEGMPMGILEALSYGLPCVLTRGTTLSDRVAAAGAGFAAENTASSIAAALKSALSVAESRQLKSYGDAARTFVEQNFSWETVARDTVSIYKKMGDGCLERT
ncbi:MAG: LicD family protein [Clostridia bacterium]|nr:LicD family protein [Clostridia bacterium]